MAAEKLDFDRRAPVVAGQGQERGVERGVGFRADGRVIDRGASELLQPVVGARVELDDVEPLLDQRDEGQEQRPVEPVLVEIVGRDVRSRRHHDARGEQRREQSGQDHRVGDVAHRKLVEAQERSLARQFRRDRRDRIFARDFAALQRLAPLVQPCVHVGHEGVEVRPALEPRRGRVEEHVHQHGLAAADRAVDINPARRLGGLEPHQAREGAGLGLRAIAVEARGERIKSQRKLRLRWIVLEAVVENERAVALGD